MPINCYQFAKIVQSDLNEIEEIENRCYKNPWKYHHFLSELNNPFSFCYKISIINTIIGYSFSIHTDQNLHINNICIDIPFQKKSFGFQLLNFLTSEAKNQGVRFITLEVSLRNEAACNLYLKHGFKKDKILKSFYTDGSDAQFMMLSV